ncbi:hypothetical protein [Aquirufa regiilacus]|uniref:SH3 domain-containing protein n=1 Tax=Aquirufa regiilacus TaxID=3024868 RepID=A0ABU3TQ89_9BACT|nr:hypothetical protein [Aquirufa sp. LEOWEIH-7C]MDU0808025.1 hypothetical protein [Aquirufa sp. LEOWEIH-7C]
MNGEDFYTFLKSSLSNQDIVSEKGNLFIKWLNNEDLQFSIPNNSPKSIPKHIIILARETHNKGIKITNNWLIANECNRGWCLADVLNYLLIQSEKPRNSNNTLEAINPADFEHSILLADNSQSNISGQTSESLTSGLNNISLNKNSPQSKSNNFLPILFVSLFFIFGIYSYLKTNYSEIFNINLHKISDTKSNEQEPPCTGLGTDVCIDKVRLNFENTGKTILGEEYLGNGNFGISFIDRNKPGSYSARVSTDCECGITNVQVSNLR